MRLFTLNTVIDFGKHKGKTVKEVEDLGWQGHNYLVWVNENANDVRLAPDVFEYCLERGREYARDYQKKQAEKACRVDGGLAFDRRMTGPRGEYAQMACDQDMDFDDDDMDDFS